MPDQQTVATTHVPAQHEAEPNFYGVTPPMFIALAMLAVIGALIWKKVPGAIAGALDAKIALIRDQLAEAESLRKEAEALKAEYEARAKSADKDRKALLERAKHEADEIGRRQDRGRRAQRGRATPRSRRRCRDQGRRPPDR